MSWKQAGVNFIRMAVLLVLVSMAAFFLVSVSPLDPLTTNVGQAALGSMSSEQIARLQEYWGVNTPPVTRYLAWAGDFLKGDMGISLLYRRPVAQVIGEKLANSLWIMAAAWILSGLIGFLMGIIAGGKEGKDCGPNYLFLCPGNCQYAGLLGGSGTACRVRGLA